MPNPFLFVLIAILGLEFGSFANVCIYRWPRNGSVLWPRRSFCPWCQKTLRWYDNIPLLSFLFLKGRCRFCKSRISFRYPLIEVSVPLLWLAVYVVFQLNSIKPTFITLIAVFFLVFVIVVTTVTDLDWKIIPDHLTYSLALVGLLTSPWNPFFEPLPPFNKILMALVGLLAGGGMLWGIGFVGRFLLKKEVMGGGDIKLLAAFGSFFGWKGAILTLLSGSLIGSFVAIPLLATGMLRRNQYIPFGPFLNIGCLTVLFLLAVFPNFTSALLFPSF